MTTDRHLGYWHELAKYLGECDLKLIKEGYDWAERVHLGKYRESGDAYISHPAWVAKVVAQLNLGTEAVLAALLHDCLSGEQIEVETIADQFGDEVALLVTGLTEVRKNIKGLEINQANIEVFRKFLFSSVDDVRVLIIRIVDKLHNGLTIDSLSTDRQKNYAQKVMAIYAPIAEYVGLHYFKRILEDIAFLILQPEECREIESKLLTFHPEEKRALLLVKRSIRRDLISNRINNYMLQSRIKGLYSTYLKGKRRMSDEIYDRVGIRIIVGSVADCYTVLGLLHAKYPYLTDEFDDYISAPKPSGYRSLQTTIVWNQNLTVEVQIRTFEMHDYNEFGPASHIAYKTMKGNVGSGLEWVRDLVRWQNDKNVNSYRINVLANYVYVFTPKGDVVQLPKGSTVIDFAYRIHSSLGSRCKGALINQKMAKISSELKTGDLVEILAGKKNNVTEKWLDFAKTKPARDEIKRSSVRG